MPGHTTDGGTADVAEAIASPQNSKEAANDLDHPEGVAIRRQVEFYFSDENLRTDLHLLQHCHGRENQPVSTNRILGFKKMRAYKPKKLVVAALRKSAFLELSADGKTIKRKVPLTGKCLLDPDFLEDDGIAHDPRVKKAVAYPVPLIPLKADNPQGLSKNMLKPTGFEDGYVEPLQTPQEAAEEEALYDLDKHFVERIEIAIQRFKQRRRMHQKYQQVFEKFLRFGGVEYGTRQYQGLSKEDLKEMDVEERTRALMTHTVPWDRSDEKYWVVDFAGVAKAFLSSWYPVQNGYSPEIIKNACQVLRSFYNYLLYHNVCPEYKDALDDARSICDAAERELLKVSAASRAFPGEFNKSGSTLFGGTFAGMYVGNDSWADEWKTGDVQVEELGIRNEEARIKFFTGVTIMGTEEQYEMVESESFKVVDDLATHLEIISMHAPEDSTRASYIQQSEALQHKLGALEPLGRIMCKTWYVGDCDEWDLPQDDKNFPDGKPSKTNEGRTYEFWIEESIQDQCFVGMKLDARILILEGGLNILDDVRQVMCSFFIWLPNRIRMEKKVKKVVWKKRDTWDDDEETDTGGVKKDTEGGLASHGNGDDKYDDEFDDE